MSSFTDKLEDDLEEGIWTTISGGEIHVSRLTDSHLISIIAHLKKDSTHKFKDEWLKTMMQEQDDRQKMVTNEFEDIS